MSRRRTYRWNNALQWSRTMTANHARILVLPVLLLALLAARGCTSTTSHHGISPDFARMSVLPPDAALALADFFPERSEAVLYRFIDDAKGLDTIEFMRAPTDRHGAAWATAEGETRVDYWASDGVGNVQLKAVFDVEDGTISHFDPPLTVPADLVPGAPHREQVAMRVVDARNPKKQKAAGTATRTIEYVDNQRIRIEGRDVVAQRLVSHLKCDLGMATAEISTTYYIVPGVGLVAEQSRERIRVLGVFGRSNNRTIVRIAENSIPADSLNSDSRNMTR